MAQNEGLIKCYISFSYAEELRRTRLQIIQRLGRASEYKDNETGMHVMRMSHYSKIIALAYGYSPEEADTLFHAAPMHDIGKIGIPDRIMLKPGKLTDEEFAEMKKHPEIGSEILGDADSYLIALAKSVAMTHHEKWDGSGYPRGLRGEQIPIGARIFALSDIWDALISDRRYHRAWPRAKVVEHIRSRAGTHFDPDLVDLFLANV